MANFEVGYLEKINWPWGESNVAPKYKDHSLWPKISIVTPSYNQGAFIEETIRSVVLQGYPNLEYILIDGGSTDRTIDIIKKYEALITYWVSEKDEGQSHAINKGFSKATGDIYYWLNSDDILLPDALYKVAESFKATNFSWLVGECIFSDVHLKPRWQYRILTEEPIRYLEFWNSIFLAQPSVFFSSTLWINHGQCRKDLYYSMDLELWLRFFEQSRPVFLRDNLSINRIYDNTKTSSGGLDGIQEISKVLYHSNLNQSIQYFSLKTIETSMKVYYEQTVSTNFFYEFNKVFNRIASSKITGFNYAKILIKINYIFIRQLFKKAKTSNFRK